MKSIVLLLSVLISFSAMATDKDKPQERKLERVASLETHLKKNCPLTYNQPATGKLLTNMRKFAEGKESVDPIFDHHDVQLACGKEQESQKTAAK